MGPKSAPTLAAAILLFSCTAATSRADASCDVDCSLSRLIGEEKVAGAVYGLIDGDVSRTGATGSSDHANRETMRADHKVHVGSIAKTFIALGVLRLATQQRVDLDAPLDTLLPAIRIDNPWAPRTPVTLRHLLDHTSGLDDTRLWQIFTLRADPDAPLARAFDGAPGLLRVRVEPGSTFSYSNMGYTLAAMVIESVTRERYESWLDRELLAPLGMRDSTATFVSQTGHEPDARLAWGHLDDFTPAAALPIWLRPAAQFTTTADDMLRAARFLMSDGRIGGDVFIEERLLLQMGRATSTDAARAGLGAGYALGLALRDRHGAIGLCHLGNIVGFRAALCLYPEQRKAFFVSVNSDSETANYLRFDAALVDALGIASPTAPDAAASPPTEWRGRYVRSPARFETFRYFDLLLDTVVLDIDDGRLVMRRTGGAPQQLSPVGSHLYRAPDRVAASHVLLSTAGAAAFSDGTATFQRVSNARFFGHWLSLGLGVLGLLVFLVLIPWRKLSHGESLRQPATFAWIALLAPLPLFATQSFVAIGDATAASIALFVATAALPPLMIWQIVRAIRHRAGAKLLHVAAAAFVLQWCAVLWSYGLLPFATWR